MLLYLFVLYLPQSILSISHLLSRVFVLPRYFSCMGLPPIVLRKVLVSIPLAFGISGYLSIGTRFRFLFPLLSYREEIRRTAMLFLSLPIETTLRFLPFPPTSILSFVIYTLPRMYLFFLLVLITHLELYGQRFCVNSRSIFARNCSIIVFP